MPLKRAGRALRVKLIVNFKQDRVQLILVENGVKGLDLYGVFEC